jgi:hypothetical protein
MRQEEWVIWNDDRSNYRENRLHVSEENNGNIQYKQILYSVIGEEGTLNNKFGLNSLISQYYQFKMKMRRISLKLGTKKELFRKTLHR